MHIKYTSAGLQKYVPALTIREEETSGEYKNISLQHTDIILSHTFLQVASGPKLYLWSPVLETAHHVSHNICTIQKDLLLYYPL
jgi:hypothetical protein